MNATQSAPEQETPLDPATALAILTQQQDAVARRLAGGLPLILGAWGVAWGVGFLMLWLIEGLAPGFRMPLPLAVAAFAVLMAGALVASAVLGARMGRGIRGSRAAAWTGAVFGLSWPVGFAGITALGFALRVNGMDPALLNIYYPTAATMLVGLLYIVAGGIWQNGASIAMGGWIMLVAGIAPFFGAPTHYLVFAVAGGGVFVIASIVAAVWIRGGGRARRTDGPSR